MVFDEASKKRADDATGRKGTVEEAVRLRSGALAKNPRAFFFLLVDTVNNLGDHRGDHKGDGEADECEKRAEEHFLSQAGVCDQAEKHEKRNGRNKTPGSEIARAIFVCEET